jgi:hypothetical protein
MMLIKLIKKFKTIVGKLFLFLFIVTLLTCKVYSGDVPGTRSNPRDPIEVNHLIWIETNTNGNDYTMYTTMVNYRQVHLRYDFIDRGRLHRGWFHYGDIPVIERRNFTFDVRPGIGADNQDNVYYGGEFTADFPEIGFSLFQRSYAGSLVDQHHSFFDQRIMDNLNIRYYRFAQAGTRPDTYLGLMGIIGPIDLFYGISPNNPGAQNITISGSYRF